jgi:hypothetical protein
MAKSGKRADGDAEIRRLVTEIHRVNPTERGLSRAAEARRYAEKAALQSELVERFPAELRFAMTPGSPGVVALDLPRLGLDAAHVPLTALTDTARSLAQRALDAPPEDEPSVPFRPKGDAALADDLAVGAAALAAYDFEAAERHFRAGLGGSRGAAAAEALLTLFVDHLFDSPSAREVFDGLPAPLAVRPGLRALAAVAAARERDSARARALADGLRGPRVAEVWLHLAEACVDAEDLGEAERCLARARAEDAHVVGAQGVEERLREWRHRTLAPALEALSALVSEPTADADALTRAGTLAAEVGALMPDHPMLARAHAWLAARRREAAQVQALCAFDEAVAAGHWRRARAAGREALEVGVTPAALTPSLGVVEGRLRAVEDAERTERVVHHLEASEDEGALEWARLEAPLRAAVQARGTWPLLERLIALEGAGQPIDRAAVRAVRALAEALASEASEAGGGAEAAVAHLRPHAARLAGLPEWQALLVRAERSTADRLRRSWSAALEEAERALDAERAGEALDLLARLPAAPDAMADARRQHIFDRARATLADAVARGRESERVARLQEARETTGLFFVEGPAPVPPRPRSTLGDVAPLLSLGGDEAVVQVAFGRSIVLALLRHGVPGAARLAAFRASHDRPDVEVVHAGDAILCLVDGTALYRFTADLTRLEGFHLFANALGTGTRVEQGCIVLGDGSQDARVLVELGNRKLGTTELQLLRQEQGGAPRVWSKAFLGHTIPRPGAWLFSMHIGEAQASRLCDCAGRPMCTLPDPEPIPRGQRRPFVSHVHHTSGAGGESVWYLSGTAEDAPLSLAQVGLDGRLLAKAPAPGSLDVPPVLAWSEALGDLVLLDETEPENEASPVHGLVRAGTDAAARSYPVGPDASLVVDRNGEHPALLVAADSGPVVWRPWQEALSEEARRWTLQPIGRNRQTLAGELDSCGEDRQFVVPHSAWARRDLARKLGAEVDGAIDKALLDPIGGGKAQDLLALAAVCTDPGRFDAAAAHLLAQMRSDASYADVAVELALIAAERGRHERSRALCREVPEDAGDPTAAERAFRVGACAWMAGEFERAARCWRRWEDDPSMAACDFRFWATQAEIAAGVAPVAEDDTGPGAVVIALRAVDTAARAGQWHDAWEALTSPVLAATQHPLLHARRVWTAVMATEVHPVLRWLSLLDALDLHRDAFELDAPDGDARPDWLPADSEITERGRAVAEALRRGLAGLE